MTMFKRFSCIALGTVVTSLVSVIEPAQAFNSSVDDTAAASVQTVSKQTDSFAQTGSARTMSQTTLSTATTGVADVAVIAGLIIMLLEGLDGNGNGGSATAPIDQPVDKGNPIDPGNPPKEVPTPALLPGFVGMGIAAIRKRRQTKTDQD
ncbi:MAG: PTPA-CTERM sorting domain-containing protein [Cyanobacteria bacterium P01_H01_bin.21]